MQCSLKSIYYLYYSFEKAQSLISLLMISNDDCDVGSLVAIVIKIKCVQNNFNENGVEQLNLEAYSICIYPHLKHSQYAIYNHLLSHD